MSVPYGTTGTCRTDCGQCETVFPERESLLSGLYQCNNTESDHYQHVFTYEHPCCDEAEYAIG